MLPYLTLLNNLIHYITKHIFLFIIPIINLEKNYIYKC